MIPKIIHYCWFGGNPLPPLAIKCIDSWKKYFPDYQIVQWDESNFDVNAISYTRDAYKAKKYAFVSDYARFWILYRDGGLYFDTDVEVIRPMDDIIEKGAFMGCENTIVEKDNQDSESFLGVNPGLGLGVAAGNALYKEIIDLYSGMKFELNSERTYTTVVEYVSGLLYAKGMKNVNGIQKIDGIYIYPADFFCPMSFDGEMRMTANTRSIHHYASTWYSPTRRFIRKVMMMLGGKRLKDFVKRLSQRFVNV